MLYANINSKDAYIEALRQTIIEFMKLCICQYPAEGQEQRDCDRCRHAKKLLDH